MNNMRFEQRARSRKRQIQELFFTPGVRTRWEKGETEPNSGIAKAIEDEEALILSIVFHCPVILFWFVCLLFSFKMLGRLS